MLKMQQRQLYTTLGIIAVAILIIWAVRSYRSGKLRQLTNPGGGIAPAPGTTPAANLDYTRILGIGTRGAEVKELQRLLNADGATPPLSVDGIFGAKTQAALLAKRNVDEITLNTYGTGRNNLTTANGLPNGAQNLVTNTSGGITGGLPGTFF